MGDPIKSNKKNSTHKIDLHAHYLPQSYNEALANSGERNPDGFPTPEWTPDTHLEVMKRIGISKSMLSISSPHINFGDDNATKILARKVNEAGAELVNKYPKHFGILASLPLPNVENSIEEIKYAMDILHVDGFTLPTNTQGVYLGNPCLDPIFEELNKRKAIVVIHPNKPSSVPQNVVEGLPIPMMEFFFDTTRTITNMILNGTIKRFKDIKIIVPHAGAFLPILADRLNSALQMLPSLFKSDIKNSKDRIDVYAELKELYYDVAGVCIPSQLPSLLKIVDVDHLLYGSDYPYTPEVGCKNLSDDLDKIDLFTDEQRHAIYQDNALKLFPRFKEI